MATITQIRSFTSASSLRKFLRTYSLVLMLIGVTLIFTLFQRAYISVENVIGILYQVSLIGTMAVFATLVILTGGIDLSVGPVMAIAGLVTVFALESYGQSLPVSIFLGVLSGALIGAFNGLAISVFRLPAFVVTLATMTIMRGVALLVGGSVLHQIRGPAEFLFIGSGKVAGLPVPIYIFAGVTLLLYILQTRTQFGLNIFAIGENAEAARLCGLPVTRTRMLAYILAGIGSAIGGLILSAQVSTASATYGNGYDLDVIAAVILGGSSLRGGSGSVARTVIGALLIGMINNGLSMLNVSTDQQLIAKGLIIIIAIALSDWLTRWAEK
jgi:ribose/xylose/arabinose/galactoside ABC-type transport system permease subunit